MTESAPIPVQDSIPEALVRRIGAILHGGGSILVLTGAGISAESGIPTFRGPDGYWTVGSRQYQAQEMATFSMFKSQPEVVWSWYLYRRGVCRSVKPNPGHYAVTRLEELFAGRFQLITQNVDGLHLEAKTSTGNVYEIHGNIDYARCAAGCREGAWKLPGDVILSGQSAVSLPDSIRRQLHCPRCGDWARPHVLWFDEFYNEADYYYDSSIRAAARADILMVVGTSGLTNLPLQVGMTAAPRDALLIDVNIDDNPFSGLADAHRGYFLRGRSAQLLPELVHRLSVQP